jgi:hypothetical protein
MSEQHQDLAPLYIQHLSLTDDGRDFVLRFSGPNADFLAFVADLKREGYQYARWSPEELEGRGAWIVDFSVFKSYADRFNNYELRAGRAVDRFFQKSELRAGGQAS